jgi:integrase/recombinase XerD
MAYLGIRPSEIGRMQPQDLGEVSVLVRTGKGGRVRVVPVAGPGATAAIAELKRLKAYGTPFSTSSLYKSWKLAQTNAGPPAGGAPFASVRPYDLRHSFGSAVYAASGDQYAVQQLLGHAQSRTTERYTLAAVSGRLKSVVHAAFGGE